MSQYTFRVASDIMCRTGWDPALRTYFGQAYLVDQNGEQVEVDEATGEDVEATLRWVGIPPSPQLLTVDALVTALGLAYPIPAEICHQLASDSVLARIEEKNRTDDPPDIDPDEFWKIIEDLDL